MALIALFANVPVGWSTTTDLMISEQKMVSQQLRLPLHNWINSRFDRQQLHEIGLHTQPATQPDLILMSPSICSAGLDSTHVDTMPRLCFIVGQSYTLGCNLLGCTGSD